MSTSIRTRRRTTSRRKALASGYHRDVHSLNLDANRLDCVAAVAETIPFGLLGLGTAGLIGRPCSHGAGTPYVALCEEFPPLPAVSAAFADQSCGLPRTPAYGDVNPFDWRRARPSNAAHHEFIASHRRAVCRLSDQRANALQPNGLADNPAITLPIVAIPLRLEKSLERLADHLDLRQPLDRRHRIPAWNYQPGRASMLQRQWFAVHRVCDECTGAAGVVHRQGALEPHRRGCAVDQSRVGSPKHDVLGTGRQARPVEELHQRNARPFRSARRPEMPLLAGDRRVEILSAVAGTFQRHDQRL